MKLSFVPLQIPDAIQLHPHRMRHDILRRQQQPNNNTNNNQKLNAPIKEGNDLKILLGFFGIR